jgi:integrase
MQIGQLIDLFFTTKAADLKPASVRFYQQRLKVFREKYQAQEAATITLAEINAHLAALAAAHQAKTGRALSNSTRHHNAVVLEVLFQFAIDSEILEKLPWKGKLKKPPIGRREKLPTDGDIAAILKHASPAFKLIFRALWQSGARPDELCRATIADYKEGLIELADHKTAGKTGVSRKIGVGKKLKPLILEAIDGRTEGPIFRAPSGRAWTVPNLSATFRGLRDKAGLPKWICLYLLRHCAGSRICREKGIHAAAQVLGHRNVSTTQRYVKTNLEDLQAFGDVGGDLPPDAAADPPPAAETPAGPPEEKKAA